MDAGNSAKIALLKFCKNHGWISSVLPLLPCSSPCWSHKAIFFFFLWKWKKKNERRILKTIFFPNPICYFSICKIWREALVHGWLKTIFFFNNAWRKYFSPTKGRHHSYVLGWEESSGSHRSAIKHQSMTPAAVFSQNESKLQHYNSKWCFLSICPCSDSWGPA